MYPSQPGQPYQQQPPPYQQPAPKANFGGIEGGSFDVETMASLGLPPNTYVVRIDSIEPGLTQDKTKTKLQFNATSAQPTATVPAGKKHIWSETNPGILAGNLVRAGIRGALPSNVQQLAQFLNQQMAGRFYIISVVQQKKDPSRTNTSISAPYDPQVGLPQTTLQQPPMQGPPPAAQPFAMPVPAQQQPPAGGGVPAAAAWPTAPPAVPLLQQGQGFGQPQAPMPAAPQPVAGAPLGAPAPTMQQPPPIDPNSAFAGV